MKLSISGLLSRFYIFLAVFSLAFIISSSVSAEKLADVNGSSNEMNPSKQQKSMKAATMIPSAFLGKWAIDPEHCSGDVDYDDVITIDVNSIAGYEVGCSLTKGISSANAFSGQFLCNESGEEYHQFKMFQLGEKSAITISSESNEGKNVEVSKQVYVSCHS